MSGRDIWKLLCGYRLQPAAPERFDLAYVINNYLKGKEPAPFDLLY
jgi:hypothetical protein